MLELGHGKSDVPDDFECGYRYTIPTNPLEPSLHPIPTNTLTLTQPKQTESTYQAIPS